MRVRSLVGKIPWRRAWQPTSVFFPEASRGLRSPAHYSPRVAESDMTERLRRRQHRRRVPVPTGGGPTHQEAAHPVLSSLCSATREVTAARSLRTTAREQPLLSAPGESPRTATETSTAKDA